MAKLLANRPGWDPEAVLARVAAHPEEASIADADGELPVHQKRVYKNPRVLAAVLAAHPAGARAYINMPWLHDDDFRYRYRYFDDDALRASKTVLALAVASGAPAESIALLLEAAPETAAIADEDGYLPVHKISATTPLEVARLLIRAHPAGARALTRSSGTPLHLAVANGACTAAVALLLEAAPEVAAIAGCVMCLPLHMVTRGTPLEVVRLLIRAHPAGASALTSDGNTPLHHAVFEGVPADSIALLLEVAPEAAVTVNVKKWLPLHMITAATPLEVVRLLIRAHPAGLALADVDGELPLHGAVKKARLEVVSAVASAYPAAVRMRRGAMVCSFMERALDYEDSGMVAWVLNAHMALLLPALIQRRGTSRGDSDGSASGQGQLQLRDWDEGAAAADVDAWIALVQNGRDAHVSVVEAFLNAHASHVAELAGATDSFGRKALDLSTPGVKRALQTRLYLMGRYSVSGPPEHASATSIVYRGLDILDEGATEVATGGAGTSPPAAAAEGKRAAPALLADPRHVILKFVRRRPEFERERDARALLQRMDAAGTSSTTGSSSSRVRTRAADCIVPLLRCHDVASDAEFARQVAAQPYDTHPHLLVLAAGERSLAAVIDAERAAPRWQSKCVRAKREVAEALAALHDAGVVHGDVKARNVLRVSDGTYKLIDLDAAAPVGGYVGAKLSTAVAAPELLAARASARARSGAAASAVIAAAVASGGGSDGVESHGPGLIPASPAVDMWGLGALLFHMLRGATLVHADAADNAVSPADEAAMAAWDDDARRTALAGIADAHARHLLAALLAPDPARRPSAAAVLNHPFLTGRAAARLPGDAPEYDVFISYHAASEAVLARELHARLSQAGLRVWLDAVCLVEGHRWLDGFCEGLARSRVCVSLLSMAGMGSWAGLTPESPCDNVLLEHRLALELRARGLLEAIFPVFVGPPLPVVVPVSTDGDGGTNVVRGSLFEALRSGAMAPPADVVVTAVEATLRTQLDGTLGLGVPLRDAASAAAVWAEVAAFPGAQLSGDHAPGMDALVQRIAATVTGGPAS